jgi:hypothetical protein
MSFDLCHHPLKIQKSIGTPTPKVGIHLGVWNVTLLHSPTLPRAWNVTLLHSPTLPRAWNVTLLHSPTLPRAWNVTLLHSPTLPKAWNVTLGFHFWSTPSQTFALVTNPRLGLWHFTLKSFDIVYVCEVHGKRMVWHTSYT